MKSAKFIKSASATEHFPKAGLPEVAVVGRSNVGKSSLLNFLFQTKGLAKTSQQPGKTRLINFFESDDGILFVDLPGWGYAKASKSIRAEWGQLIEDYLGAREPLKAVLFLLDIRREPTQEDVDMAKWFESTGLTVIYVLTKSDKVNRNELQKQAKAIENAFGKEPVITSSAKGDGRLHLLKTIKDAL